MSVRPRRGRAAPSHGHDGPDERWMASYLDMITVLMCMFIVMFAMSTVDQEKFEALRASLATGFGAEVSDRTDASEGVVVPEELLDEKGEGFTAVHLTEAETEYDQLSELRIRLQEALDAQGLGTAVTFTIDERGLTIGLVSGETFFGTNSTDLSDQARAVLGAMGGILAAQPNEISVEGHADSRAPVAPYPTNWELSAGRSTQVLRFLVETAGVDGTRVQSVGYGDTRPVAAGAGDAELAQNRRVDIVILSEAEEEVRQLLPTVVAAASSR